MEKLNIKHKVFDTFDINSPEVVNAVKDCKTENILYSGPGGTILKGHILSQGKKFIHVHPGWLPEFKGSTTMYYSILLDLTISCSIIFLNEKIDSGSILYRKKFKIREKNVDIDYVLDPAVRAATLIEFFNSLGKNNKIKELNVNNTKSNAFYIIHPVLKHIAILKLRNQL